MPMRISSLISSLYDRSSSFKEAIRHAGGAKTWLSSLGDPFVVNLDCPSGHESIMLKLDKPVPAVAPAPPPPAPEAEEGVAGVGVGDGDGDEDDEGLPAGLPPPPARVPFGGGLPPPPAMLDGHDDDDDLPRGLPPPPGKVLSNGALHPALTANLDMDESAALGGLTCAVQRDCPGNRALRGGRKGGEGGGVSGISDRKESNTEPTPASGRSSSRN